MAVFSRSLILALSRHVIILYYLLDSYLQLIKKTFLAVHIKNTVNVIDKLKMTNSYGKGKVVPVLN
jgi:hypothetical protein